MSKWIKCSERMPDCGAEVVFYSDAAGMGFARYEMIRGKMYWVWCTGDVFNGGTEPTHWQPLPEPPT